MVLFWSLLKIRRSELTVEFMLTTSGFRVVPLWYYWTLLSFWIQSGGWVVISYSHCIVICWCGIKSFDELWTIWRRWNNIRKIGKANPTHGVSTGYKWDHLSFGTCFRNFSIWTCSPSSGSRTPLAPAADASTLYDIIKRAFNDGKNNPDSNHISLWVILIIQSLGVDVLNTY